MSATPGAFPPRVPLDGDLSDERFDQLVGVLPGIPAAKVETDPVDFKVRVPLADIVEFAKDTAAFANTDGGYILVGVEQVDGQPVVRGIDDTEASVLGEPTLLHQKLSTFLTPTPKVLCRRVPRPNDTRHSVLIFVEPFDSLPALFFRDDQNVQAHALYVRKGSASRPASKDDWLRVIEEVVERNRLRWTRQASSVVELVRDLLKSETASESAAGLPLGIPVTARNELRHALSESLDKARDLVAQIATAGPEEDVAGSRTEVMAILDDLVAKCTQQIHFDHRDGLVEVLSALRQVLEFHKARDSERDGLSLFLAEVALPRLFALGAISIRLDALWSVPLQVRQPVGDDQKWLRTYWHGVLLYLLYSAGRMPRGALKATMEYLEQTGEWADPDERQNAFVQFDYLRCLISEKDLPGGHPMADFPALYRWRVEPLVWRLITDVRVREELLGPTADRELAALMRRLDEHAVEYARATRVPSFAADKWSDPQIASFVAQYSPEGDQRQ
jgi:uncharacterized protein (DUF2267 family)